MTFLPLPEALARPLGLLLRSPRRFVLVLGLMLAAGAAEGVGVLLLIPLLAIVGVDVPSDGALGTVAATFEAAFTTLGVPLTLPVVLATYVLVVAAQGAVRYQERLLSARLVEDYKAELRERLFRAVAEADWLFHLRSRGSDVLHALTDEVSRVGAALLQALAVSATALTSLAYLGVALVLSPLATGVALATAALLLVVLRSRAARSRTAGEASSEASQGMYFSASEFLGGIKTAKSHAAERHHVRAFGSVTRELARSWVRAMRSYAEVRFYFTTGTVVVLSLLVWAAIEMIELHAAALLVLIFIFVRLMPRFSALQNNLQHLANALPAYDRLERLAREAEAAAEVPAEGLPDESREAAVEAGRGSGASPAVLALEEGIRFEGVGFAYPARGDRPALDGITLTIPARRTTAFVGPSGGGKTTLADLLIGLLRPTTGKILVDGAPLDRLDPRAWRRGIGYVTQESFLFNDTIRANLTVAGEAADEAALTEVLRIARLGELVEGLPQGLDTVVGERGVRLSGGERQRLALARALLRRPRLLVLDEATSALDYENEALIRSALEQLQGETTVVMITHRLPLVRGADRIHLIEEGRKVESGSWEELMLGQGRFPELVAAAGREG